MNNNTVRAARQNNRRGMTLIEIASVLAVQSVIMTLSVGLMYLMFDSHRSISDLFEQDRELTRLTERFRSDAHAMQQLDQDGRLVAGLRSVTYEGADGEIQRIVREMRVDDDASGDGERETIVQRETFRIGREGTIALKLVTPQQEGGPAIAEMVITTAARGGTRTCRAEAILNYDARHLALISQ